MLNTGIVTNIKGLIDKIRYNEINYVPRRLVTPARLIESKSKAWVGLEKIIADILDFGSVERRTALEFGVEFGYSSAALSNYFESVTGVDIFTGDQHAGHHGDIYEITKSNLLNFNNVNLIRADYRDFIRLNDDYYDLIHVDIIHTYEDTYACGLWSALHSKCTIFHDTQSFQEVKRAVADIAKVTGKKFYNYRYHNGLGILL
jgi:hypothetical protein